jgi:N-formylglutamate deformylase
MGQARRIVGGAVTPWLDLTPGDAPLIVSIPHSGKEIPDDVDGLLSPSRARHDTDFHVERLYAFAASLGATVLRTGISRSVIDVNRDPSGASLYPGQATTGLCPETTFDGSPLYGAGKVPDDGEIARRRSRYFEPYHGALTTQIARLRKLHRAIVVYDAHSIRSRVPRLFEGDLPLFNIGSFGGSSCARDLTDGIAALCPAGSYVVNGRFRGGWITRHYGDPANGVHAVQMELAMRGYLDEAGPWPPAWNEARAAPLQTTLRRILGACLEFALGGG